MARNTTSRFVQAQCMPRLTEYKWLKVLTDIHIPWLGIVGKNTELKQMKNLELTNSLWNKGRYSWCRNLLQMVLQRLYSHCSRGWEWKPDQGLCSLMKDHLRLHSVIEHETWKNTDDVKHHSFCVGKLQFVNRKLVFTDHLRMNITSHYFVTVHISINDFEDKKQRGNSDGDHLPWKTGSGKHPSCAWTHSMPYQTQQEGQRV